MLSKLAFFFKRYPFLHKILSAVYRNFFEKIFYGYYWRCFKYFLCIYFPEKKRLKKYGFKRIKPVNLQGWRWGKGLDRAHRRYYEAFYNENKCFVKVAKNDATIVNEIRVNSYIKKKCKDVEFTTKLIISSETFNKDTAMMAIEFVNDLQPFYIPGSIREFKEICDSFTQILKILDEARIIHADIHKGNLMVKKGGIVLLDFGISKIIDVENNVDYKARPGTFFRTNGTERIYNDAYSFIKMLEKLDVCEEYRNLEAYKNIEKLCDVNCFKVNVI